MKNVHPCTFFIDEFEAFPAWKPVVLVRNDVFQKRCFWKTRKSIYNTDVVN